MRDSDAHFILWVVLNDDTPTRRILMIFIESRESMLQINSHGLLDVVDFFHHENKQLYTKPISGTPHLQVLIFLDLHRCGKTRQPLRKMMTELFNPLTTSIPHHIENSQLNCYTNLLTGFYMIGKIGR